MREWEGGATTQRGGKGRGRRSQRAKLFVKYLEQPNGCGPSLMLGPGSLVRDLQVTFIPVSL